MIEKKDMSPVCMQQTNHEMIPLDYMRGLENTKQISLKVLYDWYECNCEQCIHLNDDCNCTYQL